MRWGEKRPHLARERRRGHPHQRNACRQQRHLGCADFVGTMALHVISRAHQMIPAALAGAAYAAASVVTVSWALSPLGLGTTQSCASPSVSG